jgi:hypothetical protein
MVSAAAERRRWRRWIRRLAGVALAALILAALTPADAADMAQSWAEPSDLGPADDSPPIPVVCRALPYAIGCSRFACIGVHPAEPAA